MRNAPDPLAGLPLALQREASPEAARPVPSLAMQQGAGQMARAAARPRMQRTLLAAYRVIALSLEGNGPQTRKELAASTGMPVNTINGRVAEMRAFPMDDTGRVLTSGRRNGESIVHLARLFRVSTVEVIEACCEWGGCNGTGRPGGPCSHCGQTIPERGAIGHAPTPESK